MKVLIVGCGRMGADLAVRLFRRDHDVAIIDNVVAAFNNLPADFRGKVTEGDALCQDVLQRAGIQNVDAVAIVTNSDPLNAVVGHVAKTFYHVPIVIVRNYDPRCRPLLEAFGLQLVSSTSWGAQRVEELMSNLTARTVFSAGNGEVEIYEFIVPQSMDGHPLSELLSQESCRAVSLTRAGKATIPDNDEILQTGDAILISATFEGMDSVRNCLCLSVKKE